MKYSSISSYAKSYLNNLMCRSCSCSKKENLEQLVKSKQEYISNNGIRKCPECNNDIKYSCFDTYIHACNLNSKCKECRKKPENNPMYGKSLYETWIEKYGEEIANEKQKQRSENWLDTFKENDNGKLSIRMSQQNKGKNNGMYSKSVYDVWLQKYGKKEADKRQQQMIEKCRKASSGRNNPMFSKPSPKRSGNGWSGHY
jgi:uncharacterized protein with von Willebrand factor type A (vWA) domain